jgi:hypothetical protein
MKFSLSAATLLTFATLSGICAGSYAKWAVGAPSAKDALPLALPFALFATSSASALVLAGVAAIDAGAKRP